MTRISLPETAHQIIVAHIRPGDIAIDATTGNGHDTLFLARQVGPQGHVYGFDIQSQAITATRQRLAEAQRQGQVTLFQASHADMAAKIPVDLHGRIQAIMFNLGYLPGSDKSVITRSESTLAALACATRLLAPSGVMTVLAYPGHAGGDHETAQVQTWLETLNPNRFDHRIVYSNVDKACAPRLYHIDKRR
ncbi:class I SAM-dependent methyltransferase [Methylomarinum sp. Ch1-1]|uniref:Class I SAM-dependent methyltransferase n=1 Tax=Methylomarinum roseum TaxID=3067653 RepID=A0AAU7NZX0_9GAMM|nr:class I SAM-dependent methyltransferase [Methylomarinum sp. Ch1-1]MDP4521365.1 class I SAM-dependent methyltransferase [Methylomarinum sp. Ch1-1]